MRVFLATNTPLAVRKSLTTARTDLARKGVRGIRWAAAEGVHLTLRFCGELTAEGVARIDEALTPGPPVAPFSLRLSGLGVFQPRGKPRVLWLGVLAPDALAVLAAWAEERVVTAGLSPEKRSYHPHFTLGRFRNPGGSLPRSLLESWRLPHPCDFRVDRVILFQSLLTPGGARYQALQAYPLQRGDGIEEPS